MKFFVATVALRQVVQVEVSGVDEQAAIQAAKALASQKHQGTVVDVTLGLRGESDLNPGTRVVHDIFGPGEVSEIEGAYGGSWRLTVKFDRGDTKHLQSPHPSLRPEAL